MRRLILLAACLGHRRRSSGSSASSPISRRGSARAAGISDASASVRVGFVRNHSVYTVLPDGHGTTLVLKAHPPGASAGPDNVLCAGSPRGRPAASTLPCTYRRSSRMSGSTSGCSIGTGTTSQPSRGGASPSWSPDGKQLVYGDFDGGWIHVANLATGRVRGLTTHFGAPPYDYTPAWSPNGTAIAFSRDPKGAGGQAVALGCTSCSRTAKAFAGYPTRWLSTLPGHRTAQPSRSMTTAESASSAQTAETSTTSSRTSQHTQPSRPGLPTAPRSPTSVATTSGSTGSPTRAHTSSSRTRPTRPGRTGKHRSWFRPHAGRRAPPRNSLAASSRSRAAYPRR